MAISEAMLEDGEHRDGLGRAVGPGAQSFADAVNNAALSAAQWWAMRTCPGGYGLPVRPATARDGAVPDGELLEDRAVSVVPARNRPVADARLPQPPCSFGGSV
ncbi:hypothetical protein NOU13_28115 [Rhodococcus erythropolis]|uniref:hypothetical protein n=1 Tax=Rhodococcus erythropolis TaxID=1833 RepID=UPI00210CFFE6|nr:hypothetical protein [Rhodococcus erythropolis]MCQ4128369.1 hypothetical protein [Rhodococcus erythropolis]